MLYNAASPEGTQIASYYAQLYPGVQMLALDDVPTTEQISAEVYLNQIRPQVLGALTDSIDCIVTTKGLPLRIDNPSPGPLPGWNRYSSLESELARIDSISSQAGMGDQGILNPLAINPYYGRAQPFAHTTYGTRLATRLDGFSAEDVIASIGRSQKAVIGRPGCLFVLDDHPGRIDRMELLRDKVLVPGNQPHVYDGTDAFVRDAPAPVLGYVSHGVHGGVSESYIRDADYGLAFPFAPGAVFHTWESFNAYTFQGDNSIPSPKGQGLVAQWIARGGTVGTGHVQEPGASSLGVTNEDVLFARLLNGFTWAEAAWSATAQLSFVNTVVGNPLMVYRPWVPGDCDLDGDVDIFDVSIVGVAYGTRIGDAKYNFWADMNADGDVDFWDLTFVDWNYTGPTLPEAGSSSVPEPASAALLILGLCVVARRRHDRRSQG
ncbi:MAG: hypothetical protein AMJ81_04850 [Phycisphaerae bacterium SM23_33]|nr:MAG: hypothetical protein AMJ81_04850 [Phycisphaerae bacterium SM23_33]